MQRPILIAAFFAAFVFPAVAAADGPQPLAPPTQQVPGQPADKGQALNGRIDLFGLHGGVGAAPAPVIRGDRIIIFGPSSFDAFNAQRRGAFFPKQKVSFALFGAPQTFAGFNAVRRGKFAKDVPFRGRALNLGGIQTFANTPFPNNGFINTPFANQPFPNQPFVGQPFVGGPFPGRTFTGVTGFGTGFPGRIGTTGRFGGFSGGFSGGFRGGFSGGFGGGSF